MRCAISLTILGGLLGAAPQSSSAIRLNRSLSGPAGKVVGSRFVFDETRSSFVFPHDKSLTIYFEWDAPPGDHALTGIWKAPDGRAVSISPDVRIQTQTRDLNAYWTFTLTDGLPSGIWTLEVRVDGQPGGSHPFELIVPEVPKPVTDTGPAQASPTVEQIYRATLPAMVWVHKLDAEGRRVDTGSGFVAAKDQIVTAFQSIDGAALLEVEFAGGRKVRTEELWSCNRLQDWAVLKADTLAIAPLKRATKPVPVGERMLVLNVETGQVRAIGGVDITGRETIPVFGERVVLSPPPTNEAVGGPLLDLAGDVLGIVGGSLVPGARFERRSMSVSGALWFGLNSSRATPITLVPATFDKSPQTLPALKTSGVLSAPIVPVASFIYGGTTNLLPKDLMTAMPRDVSEFSNKDATVYVYTMWQKKEKATKGVVSAQVFDAQNRVRVTIEPKKVPLLENGPTRVSFGFSPAKLERGHYRLDLIWEDRTVWRTFFAIVD